MTRKFLFVIYAFITFPAIVFGQRSVSSENGWMSTDPVTLPSGKTWEDKHFREALMKGRDYKGYYVLVNEDKKVVKVEDLTAFCRTHNYRWNDKYTTKEIAKFGDKATSVYKFEFIPKSEYSHYVFDWTDRTASRGSQLKNKGTVYFYDAEANQFLRLENRALWTGDVVDGLIDGTGAGIWQKDDRLFYYFSGTFNRGFPVGKAKYRIVDIDANVAWRYSPKEKMPSGKQGDGPPFREVEVGRMNEGFATFRYLDDGGVRTGSPSELYGYVDQNGIIMVKPTYKSASAFNNGRAVARNDKGEEIYINKTGQFVDYTDGQKRIFAEKKAEENRIKAEQERQRLLAEQKAAEERRAAEAKEAAFKRRIEANKNTKLWSRGCRLAYRYPNGNEYILGTLEEWSENRSRVKIKIVASPSATRTYKGDLLEKNNTIWVSAHNEGWHLALDEEISAALGNDNSIKREEPRVITNTVVQKDNSPKWTRCYSCGGKGRIECSTCDGTGIEKGGWFSDDKVCSNCNGAGSYRCSSCSGKGGW